MTLFIVVSLFPATASAYAPYASRVFVGDTNVYTSTGSTYWKSDGSGGLTSEGVDASNYVVKFEIPTGSKPELTLRGVTITEAYDDGSKKCGIYANGDLNIYLAEEK